MASAATRSSLESSGRWCRHERGPNPVRGEAALRVGGETLVLRPSFAALVAAEEELGPLFALVERAAEGRLRLAEMVGAVLALRGASGPRG